MSDGEVHYEHLHECVTLLGQQGLNASVNDGRLTQVLTPTATREEIEKAVKRIAEAWKGYDNVTEFYLADEPSANLFPTLKIAVELMREYFPQCTTYINLLPNYATPQMWGTATYEEYVELFASTVGPDYLCTDYYAFLTSGRRDGLCRQSRNAEKRQPEIRVGNPADPALFGASQRLQECFPRGDRLAGESRPPLPG